uniref:Ig-like domain-containing protein n=1 Tax=Amphiprion ocellaris TaxID=80972 RepID=A0AAQ6A857_AMPOC
MTLLAVIFTHSTHRLNLARSVLPSDLSQKPTMEIPALTEGQQATLTCTAPGNFTFTIGNLTAGTRHSSTLIFTSSSKHHNTSITCKVSFKGGSAEETKTLNVTRKYTVQQLHGITVFLIGFVMGMLLSTIIACLVIKCLRYFFFLELL